MKKIILGLIVGILISSSFVYANEVFNLVKVDYPIFVNENKLEIELPLLNYEGNTYIPLRKVSEATESEVVWNGDKREVNIFPNSELKKVRMLAHVKNYYDSLFYFSVNLEKMENKLEVGFNKTMHYTDINLNTSNLFFSFNAELEFGETQVKSLEKIHNQNYEMAYKYINDIDTSSIEVILDKYKLAMTYYKKAANSMIDFKSDQHFQGYIKYLTEAKKYKLEAGTLCLKEHTNLYNKIMGKENE